MKRPNVTVIELLAMSRMLRLHILDDRFFNPIDAHATRKVAEGAMRKIEAWREANSQQSSAKKGAE